MEKKEDKKVKPLTEDQKNELSRTGFAFLILLITLIVCLTAITCFVISGLSRQDEVSGKVDCDIENITLTDFSNQSLHCYDYFSDKACPVPKNIHCSGEFTVKSNKIALMKDNWGHHIWE